MKITRVETVTVVVPVHPGSWHRLQPEATSTHVCAACRTMTLTSDICGESLRVNDLIQEPIVIEAGHAIVPEGPGLGVALDDDAVEPYRVR